MNSRGQNASHFSYIKDEKHGSTKYSDFRNTRTRERATKLEHSNLTTMAFQKTNSAAAAGSNTIYNWGINVNQEPVMAVQTSNGGTTKQTFKRENKKKIAVDPKPLTNKQNPVIEVYAHLRRNT